VVRKSDIPLKDGVAECKGTTGVEDPDGKRTAEESSEHEPQKERNRKDLKPAIAARTALGGSLSYGHSKDSICN
jgi:hypothetical protein